MKSGKFKIKNVFLKTAPVFLAGLLFLAPLLPLAVLADAPDCGGEAYYNPGCPGAPTDTGDSSSGDTSETSSGGSGSSGGCFSARGIASSIFGFRRKAENNAKNDPTGSGAGESAKDLQAAGEQESIAQNLIGRITHAAIGLFESAAEKAARKEADKLKAEAEKRAKELALKLAGDKTKDFLKDKIPGVGNILGSSVPVRDENAGKKFDTLIAKTEDIKKIAKQECLRTNILDPLAWFVAKQVIHSFTTSIVNWISGNGKEDPKFIANTPEFWKRVANEASGLVIEDLGVADLLCKPFKIQLQFALRFRDRPINTRLKCTASDVENNFRNNFFSGGWKSWIKITTEPQNNYMGAYLTSLDEIERRQAEAVEATKTDQEANGNFLGVRVCTSFSNGGICERYETRTPGKTVSDLLSKALGSDISQLELADSFNEIAVALLNRMRGWLVTGGGGNKGLLKFDGQIAGGAPSEDGGNGPGGGGPPDDLTAVATKKAEIVSRFDAYLTREIAYRDAQQEISNLIVLKEGGYEDLKSCYQEQFFVNRQNFSGKTSPTDAEKIKFNADDERLGNIIADLNATTSAIFLPLLNPVQAEISASNGTIRELSEGKTLALSVTSLTALQNVENEYLNPNGSLVSKIHNGLDVQTAEFNLKKMEASLSAVDASQELKTCQADLMALKTP